MEPVTRECQAGLIRINEKTYNLIDTPPISNNMSMKDIRNNDGLKKITDIILACSYGIQAFIFVIDIKQRDNFSKIFKIIKAYLGHIKVLKHIIVAFTNLSKKHTENPLFPEVLNKEMRDILNSVDNRWFISPNPEIYKKDSKVVLDNMKKAKELISGFRSAYTTAMFNEIIEAENREAEARKLEAEARKAENREVVVPNDGCFNLDTKVMLINKKILSMSSVRVGDQVCCGTIDGQLKFSKVYSIAHRSFEIKTKFLKVEFETIDGIRKGSLYLTPEHHIFVNNNFDYAKNLKRFHKIQVLVGTRLFQAYVMNCSREYHNGYVAIFTRSGTIIANDVLCSCYAVCPPHQNLIHYSLLPLQLFEKFGESTIIGSNGEEIHPYLYFLMHVFLYLIFIKDYLIYNEVM
ncbi:hint module-domain-containing protein [Gigaspora rosea]|uniref:Hint module-domain-containing protein n=1 Tax=Gigaspora rosea TaxID=44941 RepID=A0A397UKI3_9GLOM|nr:hint module-domain-containing protein [Gigaspora rosea]